MKHGEAIERLSEEGVALDELRQQFADFEELDGEYYDCAEQDMAAVAAYIAEHPAKFIMPV